MAQNRFGIPFWLVGEFTTHFRTDFSGWIGMFTGGTIWILTHGRLTRNGPSGLVSWKASAILDDSKFLSFFSAHTWMLNLLEWVIELTSGTVDLDVSYTG